MARKPVIFGNWKMNKTPSEAYEFMKGIEEVLTGEEAADYGIGAPYVDLDVCVKNAKNLLIAAENCNEKDSGAYTGEVSVPMLKEVGITYCIIGHSERRTYYAETDAACAAKAKRLLADNIIPILCIGETEAQYDAGETANVIKSQLEGSLAGLTEIHGENSDAHYPLRLTFTRLTIDNQEITAANSDFIDADISQATCIKLHESNKSFAIDFSTLTYAGETQGHYSYRMRGYEDEWIALKPGEHSVRYTYPKPGSYIFEVAYTNGNERDQEIISIKVEVAPYFWKSWWFILLISVAAACLGIWIYMKRMEAMRQKEAEKLLLPIRKVLDESEDSEQLQSRIENILDNHMRLQKSLYRSVEADKQEAMRNQKTFMERATLVMEENYMDSEFGITEFAEALGMSKSLVSKRLKAETSLSIGQFIRDYRLGIAKKILLENVVNRNITEIAYKVGFNDPKYFTRCFTRRYGSSPSTFVEEDALVDKN